MEPASDLLVLKQHHIEPRRHQLGAKICGIADLREPMGRPGQRHRHRCFSGPDVTALITC